MGVGGGAVLPGNKGVRGVTGGEYWGTYLNRVRRWEGGWGTWLESVKVVLGESVTRFLLRGG